MNSNCSLEYENACLQQEYIRVLPPKNHYRTHVSNHQQIQNSVDALISLSPFF